MTNNLRIGLVKVALSHREVVNSIEKVGFTFAIITYKAVKPRRQLEINLLKVFKVGNIQLLKIHYNYLQMENKGSKIEGIEYSYQKILRTLAKLKKIEDVIQANCIIIASEKLL